MITKGYNHIEWNKSTFVGLVFFWVLVANMVGVTLGIWS